MRAAGKGDFVPQRVRLELGCSGLMHDVLRRVTAMLAAQAQLDVRRVEASVALAGALSEAACDQLTGARLAIDFEMRPHSIALQVGPLPSGSGERLRQSICAGQRVFTAIADQVRVDQVAEREYLCVGVSDPEAGVRDATARRRA